MKGELGLRDVDCVERCRRMWQQQHFPITLHCQHCSGGFVCVLFIIIIFPLSSSYVYLRSGQHVTASVSDSLTETHFRALRKTCASVRVRESEYTNKKEEARGACV